MVVVEEVVGSLEVVVDVVVVLQHDTDAFLFSSPGPHRHVGAGPSTQLNPN